MPFKRPDLDPTNQAIINQTSTRVPVRTVPYRIYNNEQSMYD
jgi:hypothetical protein